VHGAAAQRGGQRSGAVPGVQDDQRDAAAAGAGRVQAAQQVLDLPGRLAGAGCGRGPLDVDQGGPRGAQVPGRRGELVLPARDGLAGAVAAAGVVMDVPAFWRALGVRAGIRGGIDGEPQPRPPRARVPDGGGLPGRQPGQGTVEQPVVDIVVLSDPGAAFVSVDELRQRAGQQRGQLLLADRPGASASYSAPCPRRNSGTSDNCTSDVTA
jgi:hypothetical protein